MYFVCRINALGYFKYNNGRNYLKVLKREREICRSVEKYTLILYAA